MPGTSPGNLIAQYLKNFLGIKTLFTILLYCSGCGRGGRFPAGSCLPLSSFLWFSDTHMGVCHMRLCYLLSHNSRYARSRVLKSVTGRERCTWLSLFGRTETLILKCNSSPTQQGVADKALFVPYFSSWESLLWLDHFFKGHMGARLGGQHTIQHGYWYGGISCCYSVAIKPETHPTLLDMRALQRVKKSVALRVSTAHLSPPFFQDHLAKYFWGSWLHNNSGVC